MENVGLANFVHEFHDFSENLGSPADSLEIVEILEEVGTAKELVEKVGLANLFHYDF